MENKQLARELILEVNRAYDKGGVDVLKLMKETAENVLKTNPLYKEEVAFTLYAVEAVRQTLEETVEKEVHDIVPEKSVII
jgi:hypothetical protein